MRKSIILTLTLALLGFAAQAQYLGIKGGLNLSNLNIDEVNDENMRTGYHFGAYFNLPVSESFALQPEVLYSTKGATATYNLDVPIFDDIEGDATFKLNYIDVPLLGVFRIGDAAEIHFGPYIGLLTNSSVDIDGDVEEEFDTDNDNFRDIDFGLVGGLAFNLNALQIGARYNYGLQEIQDSDAAEALLGDAKNSYIQVFAAIRIGAYD